MYRVKKIVELLRRLSNLLGQWASVLGQKSPTQTMRRGPISSLTIFYPIKMVKWNFPAGDPGHWSQTRTDWKPWLVWAYDPLPNPKIKNGAFWSNEWVINHVIMLRVRSSLICIKHTRFLCVNDFPSFSFLISDFWFLHCEANPTHPNEEVTVTATVTHQSTRLSHCFYHLFTLFHELCRTRKIALFSSDTASLLKKKRKKKTRSYGLFRSARCCYSVPGKNSVSLSLCSYSFSVIDGWLLVWISSIVFLVTLFIYYYYFLIK